MKKRLAGMILVLIMVSGAFGAGADSGGFTAAETEKYQKTVDFLNHLGLDGAVGGNPKDEVSRGDFLYCAVALAGIDEAVGGDDIQTPFKDILLGHPLAGVLNSALAFGIIEKSENFEPDKVIAYDEALKIAVSVLGYDDYAKLNGGWPYGYTLTASSLKLTAGAKNKSGALTRYDMVMMLGVMAETGVMSAEVTGQDALRLKTDGTMLISKYKKIYKYRGIVTADKYSGLTDPEKGTGKNEIILDYEKRFAYDLATDCLGEKVTVYYKDNESAGKTDEIVCLFVDSYSVAVNAADISHYSGYTLYCRSRERTFSHTVSMGFAMIYNGKAYNGYTDADFKPESGFVTLSDTNGDGLYDVVKVSEYEYLHINSASEVYLRITDRNTVNLLDFDSKGIIHEIYVRDADGKYILSDFSRVTVGEMIAYTASKDEEYYRVYLLDVTGGVLTGTSEDGVYIDDVFYETNEYYKEYYAKSEALDVEYIFFLGIDGRIAGIKKGGDSEYKYGYVTGIAAKGPLSKTQIRVFTEDGVLKIMTAARTVYIDGQKKSGNAAALSPLTDNAHKSQLIRYKLNTDGEIYRINTAVRADDKPDYIFSVNIPDDERFVLYYDESTQTRYKSAPRIFTPKFNINDNTVIFVVPDSEELFDDANCYSIETSNYFSNDGYYNLMVYNLNAAGTAGVIVQRVGSPALDAESGFGAVEKITTALHRSGEVMKKITVYNGKYAELFVPGDVDVKNGIIDDIQTGDVIRYTVRNGKTVTINIDFDASAEAVLGRESTKMEYIFGSLYSMENNYAYVSTAKSGSVYTYSWDALQNYLIADKNIAVIDMEKKTVYPGNREDLLTYRDSPGRASKVLLRLRWYDVEFVFIYI